MKLTIKMTMTKVMPTTKVVVADAERSKVAADGVAKRQPTSSLVNAKVADSARAAVKDEEHKDVEHKGRTKAKVKAINNSRVLIA